MTTNKFILPLVAAVLLTSVISVRAVSQNSNEEPDDYDRAYEECSDLADKSEKQTDEEEWDNMVHDCMSQKGFSVPSGWPEDNKADNGDYNEDEDEDEDNLDIDFD